MAINGFQFLIINANITKLNSIYNKKTFKVRDTYC